MKLVPAQRADSFLLAQILPAGNRYGFISPVEVWWASRQFGQPEVAGRQRLTSLFSQNWYHTQRCRSGDQRVERSLKSAPHDFLYFNFSVFDGFLTH